MLNMSPNWVWVHAFTCSVCEYGQDPQVVASTFGTTHDKERGGKGKMASVYEDQ